MSTFTEMASLPQLILQLVLVTSLARVQLAAASPTEYSVEHKFSADSEFSNRGILKCFPSTKLQCNIYNNEDLAESFNSLTGEDFYYLRVCNKDLRCVQTFLKQCLLIESNYQETLEVNASPSHDIVSVSLLTTLAVCNGTRSQSISAARMSITETKVEVMEPLPPPEPETSLYVKRVEEEKRRKLKGDGEENKSFFAKYWMYIVPVLIVFMLSSQGEQGGE